MRLNGYIPLRRGDKASAAVMMDACRSTLRDGTSIMMFPEGTRSRTSELQAFKPGAFQLARETGCALLPIVLDGTSQALPKRGFVLRGRQRIEVRVLPEVPVQTDDPRAAIELAEQTRGLVEQALTEMRSEAGAGSADSTV
jgi:1-acyl-sn-glycerol-3-phosphate acyltransferase